jgi:tetratricopeptide (TPR) repeat protein
MVVFIVSFIVYLYTMFPGVAPYRDTGEMVSAAHVLGIVHPPGYPLYTLLAKAWLLLEPFGNEGFRLNVLSAVGGAATAWFMYRIFIALMLNRAAAALLALVFAFSYLQWYLSIVSEMYTLNTMFAAAVILLIILLGRKQETNAVKEKIVKADNKNTLLLYLTAFVFGAGLGVRMDLLLAAPALFIILYSKRKEFTATSLFAAMGLAALGFSVFVYLPFRSSIVPLLDWNHPATLEKLWETLGRKTHGGTLDLISAPYASGANFPATIKFYFNHLFSGFAFIGILLALAGLSYLWKKERTLALSLFTGWLFTGPVFIYMANMPPNTHALAILEAHFLLPNVFAAVFMGAGLKSLSDTTGEAAKKLVTPAVCMLMLCVQFYGNLPELNKKENYIAYDYAKNILRSLPTNSILIMKKDVQLFALWNQQYARGQRPDCAIISEGLAASAWYKASFQKIHPDVALGPLRNAQDWKIFIEQNSSKKVFFSPDAEYFHPDGYFEVPCGILSGLEKAKNSALNQNLFNYIYPYRGKYNYTAYREFFSPDIIEDYARARIALARYYMDRSQNSAAREEFEAALALQPQFPQVYNLLGYSYVSENNYKLAAKYYAIGAKQYDKMLELAAQYNTLDDTVNGIRKEAADVYIALGVCSEKNLNDEEALAYYNQALSMWPGQTRAYYNRSVIFWKRSDWQNVIRELEQALRIDPNYREAAYYLEMAKRKTGLK